MFSLRISFKLRRKILPFSNLSMNSAMRLKISRLRSTKCKSKLIKIEATVLQLIIKERRLSKILRKSSQKLK
jgi:hypothetical protein